MQHSAHLPSLNRSLAVPLATLILGAGVATATFALINIEDNPSPSSTAVIVQPASVEPGAQRYDGGPNEGSAQLSAVPQAVPAAGVRYDGGPDEGTRGAVTQQAPSAPADGTRYDGGPDEGTRGVSGPGQ